MRVVRDIAGAIACGTLLALLLGCATVHIPVPAPEAPCVCTTDSDCADRCGGEY